MGSLPDIVEDCNGVLQLYSDGTVFRLTDIDFNVPVIKDNNIIFEDRLFEQSNNLYLRLYKPKTTPSAAKRPVIFFLHGGGFCVGSRTWPNFHNSCIRLAAGLDAVVVLPDYRLAPENKLPAPMEDSFAAVKWLEREGLTDAWLTSGVDFERVFVVGDSSGGNIAHHLAVGFWSGSGDLDPVRVRGYVMLAPFFGGVERTKSEEGPAEGLLSLEMLDRFWRLSLPIGESRDHPLVNPFGPTSPSLENVPLDPIMVIAGGNELLKDRAKDYATRLKKLGKKIEYLEFEGQKHGFFLIDPHSKESNKLIHVINRFMFECN